MPFDWSPDDASLLSELTSPSHIQAFLDQIPYSTDPVYRCPTLVMADRKAHCFDGAVFAAAALERLGFRPLIIDLRAVRDDDHVLALFWRDGALGAISKSNVSSLRFREPLFRTPRELVLSYFDFYYNLDGEKTLREFSKPVDLDKVPAARRAGNWRVDNGVMDVLAAHLDAIVHTRLLTERQEAALAPMDKRTFEAGLMGADWDGLYKPGGAKG